MKSTRLFFLLLLCGCSYRWQPEFPEGKRRPTICVPFIAGDEEGTLTAAVMSAILASGLANVCYNQGDFCLKMRVIKSEHQTVGYRRDRQKVDGKVRKNIVASEGRQNLSVEATLYRGRSEEVAYGPFQISADADYDFVDGDSIQDLAFVNKNGTFTTVLPFSLGQLESIESAQMASNRPLNQRLARKIVDVIFSEW